jgi:hypothetical protein
VSRKLPAALEKSQLLSNRVSYLIVVGMMVCLAFTFSQLARWMTYETAATLSYTFQWDFLPVFILLVSLEAIFTLPVVHELEGREKIIYHFAEWITFAVVLKLVIYAVHGFDNLAVDLPRWQANFAVFFEGEFFYAYFLVAVTWFLSRSAANNIEELNVDPTDISWELGKLQNNRTLVRAGLVSRTLWVGILMVFVTALIRLTMAGSQEAANIQVPVVSVVIYFFLALALFSQTQYALLRGSWFWNQTPISAILSKTWIRTSLIFFGLIAVISFLLPTNYSMGLLETLHYVLEFIVNVLYVFLQLLLLPIIWLLSLAGCTPQTNQIAAPQPTPPIPPLPQAPSTPIPWLELLQSILFWAVFVGVVGYALVQFMRQNPQFARVLGKLKVFNWLGSIWHWVSGLFQGAGSQVSGVVQGIGRRLFANRGKNLVRQVQHWASFRQLNPRQQIIFYYLRLVERGGQHGIPRKSFETPYQYADTLETNLPEVQEDITGMTETFLEARYSAHPIEPQSTSLVQRFWRNITRSLSRHKKPS